MLNKMQNHKYMNRFLSSIPYMPGTIVGLVRIITGILMTWHGKEVFNTTQMDGYTSWLQELTFPAAQFLAYLGKATELLCGILLIVGLFTRIASILLIGTMIFILFGMGHGRILTEDQHPFLFIIIGLLFLFYGSGKPALDQKIFT